MHELIKYINTGCLKRIDLILTCLGNRIPFHKNAEKISSRMRSHIDLKKNGNYGHHSHYILVEPMTFEVKHITELSKYLNKELKDDLYGAYIHGSIGADEKIHYSDVDALVILRDDVFKNPTRLAATAYKLNRALKYFYKIDPLQHHGWFVLTEGDLRDYPQTYFPHELFNHARSLLPDKGINIKICFDPEKQDYETPFLDLARGIRMQLEKGCCPRNMYQLKGLLSRFMLLPAVYCQARDIKGVFKKFSFDAARKDFSTSAWAIMDEVSVIRANWHYSLNPVRRYFMTRRSPLWIRLKRNIGPRIPPCLKKHLSTGFYQRMLNLIEQMEEKLHEIQAR
jgi:predicted nucleotidyltransferase